MSEKIKLRIGIILLIASIVFLTSCGTKNINETKTAEVSSSSSEFNELSENNNHDSGSTAVSRKFGAKKSPTSSENTVETNNNNSSDAQNYDSHNDYNTNHYENNETSSENNAYYAADSNTDENESSGSFNSYSSNDSSNSEQNTSPDTHVDTCSFTIDCKNAIASTKLSSSMRDILPSDGIIYKSQNLELTSGETVFDVLLRITRQSGIPMEFSSTPAFGSKYIEGINSLREFDCGETSGWKYSVNGEVPNYGCDKYTVNPGDDIIFYYVTDWGSDL